MKHELQNVRAYTIKQALGLVCVLASQGYWGHSDNTAMIAHWHGPKPLKGLECLVAAQLDGKSIDQTCSSVHQIYR
jgi:hypothetical protein